MRSTALQVLKPAHEVRIRSAMDGSFSVNWFIYSFMYRIMVISNREKNGWQLCKDKFYYIHLSILLSLFNLITLIIVNSD